MLLSLYLNLAACYLKIKDCENALAACNEALILHPLNVKALYRRSRCRIAKWDAGLKDFKLAINDLNLAHEIDPDLSPVTKELKKIKKEYI